MSFPQSSIKLVVGLGNPGPEYERTRHNAGFWFAEDVAHEIGGSFASEAKFFGQLARGVGANGDVRVLKPMKYMNLSGQSVAAVAKFFNIAPQEMLVAHDELDLAAGDIKLKFGGGHAGHNGLRDIQACLGSADFWRLRIGIGHPRTLGGRAGTTARHVVVGPGPGAQLADRARVATSARLRRVARDGRAHPRRP